MTAHLILALVAVGIAIYALAKEKSITAAGLVFVSLLLLVEPLL